MYIVLLAFDQHVCQRYLAIQSLAPGSLDGRLRVTEQGEMIEAQFGQSGIAVRTLEMYHFPSLLSHAIAYPHTLHIL